jgi:hypothetical protein
LRSDLWAFLFVWALCFASLLFSVPLKLRVCAQNPTCGQNQAKDWQDRESDGETAGKVQEQSISEAYD